MSTTYLSDGTPIVSNLKSAWRAPKASRGDTLQYKNTAALLDVLAAGLPFNAHGRELVINGKDGKATRVLLTPEWQSAERLGIYRLLCLDDAVGMYPHELRSYFLTLGEGASEHGVNEHFHIGARVSTVHWNHAGVVIVSKRDGKMYGVWIYRDENGYTSKQFRWQEPDGTWVTDSIWPVDIFSDEEIEAMGFDPARLFDFPGDRVFGPAFQGDHGTAVLLLGNTGTEHTFIGPDPALVPTDDDGKSGEKNGKSTKRRIFTRPGLNARIWDWDGLVVEAIEFPGANMAKWPRTLKQGREDKTLQKRTIDGAKKYITQVGESSWNREKKDAKVEASGTRVLSDGTKVHWFLRDEPYQSGGVAYSNDGYIAVLDDNELFAHSSHHRDYYNARITDPPVYRRTYLIFEPIRYDADQKIAGVSQDIYRTTLKVHNADGGIVDSIDNKKVDWLKEFGENLPAPIVEAIKAAKARHFTSDDAEARKERLKRFAGRFQAKWNRNRIWRAGGAGDTLGDIDHDGGRKRRGTGERTACPECGAKIHEDWCSRKRTRNQSNDNTGTKNRNYGNANPNGSTPGENASENRDLPDVIWSPDPLAEGDWAIAEWLPGENVIRAYRNHDLILNQIQDWTTRYDHWHRGEEEKVNKIAKAVVDVYGDMLISRIGHSEALLGKYEKLGNEKITGIEPGSLRSTEALTMSMLGIFAEDAAIGPRIGYVVGSSKGSRRK